MKICIFPNDPLLSYYKKGEIKKRYFNPLNFFDEVHIISLFDDEIESSKVRELAGNGLLIIHKLGKVNLLNYRSFESKVKECIQKINPDIIRSFNGLVIGWLAVKTAKCLNIPVIVSLHTNYEQQRQEVKRKGKLLQFMKLKYTSNKIEKFVMQNSDAIICVYNYIVQYAKNLKAKNIHVIYNKVDTNLFSPNCKPIIQSSIPIILSVGRLIDQKDHKILVKSIKNLNVKLLIIGDGPKYDSIVNLAKSLGISNKIEIIKYVPNEKLNGYYASAKIYAQPLVNLDGIPIPVIEAMASGLPVVISRHSDNYSEIIDDAVIQVENNPVNFTDMFQKLLDDIKFREELCKKSLSVINEIDGETMEIKELDVYKQVLDFY